MDPVAQYQRQLLEQAQYIYYETPISEATQHAFLHLPRHVFIKRYRDWGTTEWQRSTPRQCGRTFVDPLCQ